MQITAQVTRPAPPSIALIAATGVIEWGSGWLHATAEIRLCHGAAIGGIYPEGGSVNRIVGAGTGGVR